VRTDRSLVADSRRWEGLGRGAALGAVGLGVVALVLLRVGDYIQFDDTSGFGGDDVRTPYGAAAALAALAGLGVALSDYPARRAYGLFLAAVDVVLIVGARVDEGFRFVWGDDEGELFLFTCALTVVAAVLVMPRFTGTERPGGTDARRTTGWARAAGYVVGLPVAMFVAFVLGVRWFEETECGGGGGECDIAGLSGLVWSAATFVLGLVAIFVLELVIRVRARRR